MSSLFQAFDDVGLRADVRFGRERSPLSSRRPRPRRLPQQLLRDVVPRVRLLRPLIELLLHLVELRLRRLPQLRLAHLRPDVQLQQPRAQTVGLAAQLVALVERIAEGARASARWRRWCARW